jgi:hypothetical protein
MQQQLSLRKWAIDYKIWEPYSWKTFLEKDLVPFYKQAFILNEFYNFLKSEKVCGKNSLKDIEDEVLKNKVRVAIYGGAENPDTSFAKFMYDYFGLCAENASTFQESKELYENWGDNIKVSVHHKSWVSSIRITDLLHKLRRIIDKICSKIGIKLSEMGIDEKSYRPLEIIEADALLPQAGEKPEKLISLINEFKQKAVELSIGVNPFTTFVHYSRAIPLLALKEFLECDIDKVIELANFLELKAYSMIDGKEVELSTKSTDKVFLVYQYPGCANSLCHNVLELQDFLVSIEPVIEELRNNFIKEAISQIHITFEPWKDYEPIFTTLSEILKYTNYYELLLKDGKIESILPGARGWAARPLSNKVWLRNFLIRIYPIISVGIIDLAIYSNIELVFRPLAKEWIDKVIKNEGKT